VQAIKIAGQNVGPEHPCFIIAEAGVNHNSDINQAKKLVTVAAASGADAVKFQTFKSERLASASAPKAGYQLRRTDNNETQLEMLQKLELSAESHYELWIHCKELGIIFLSSPFDEISADFLEDLGVAAFKIPSGEITNWPYLKHIASKGKPMIMSTGMSSLSEVDDAVKIVREAGCQELVVLHCVSNYPADPADINLRAMQTMSKAFDIPIGYSDHTTGTEVPLAAVSLGATVIEKHFTLDRRLPGPDQEASLEPDELKTMISGIRSIELALGDGRKEPAQSESSTAAVARKSLVAAENIPSGTTLNESSITIKRPGVGLPPSMLPKVLGRTANVAIQADTLITLDMLD